MTTTLACLVSGLMLIGGQVANVPQTPWVVFQDTSGKSLLGIIAENEPFRAGVLPRAGDSRVVRDAEGRTISGVAYYGWISGSSVRLVVLAEVAAKQAKTASFPSDDPAMRYEQIASYTIAIGESRQIADLKAYDIESRIVNIELR